jgi:hypothetical protein
MNKFAEFSNGKGFALLTTSIKCIIYMQRLTIFAYANFKAPAACVCFAIDNFAWLHVARFFGTTLATVYMIQVLLHNGGT